MKEPSNPTRPKNKNAPTRVGAQFIAPQLARAIVGAGLQPGVFCPSTRNSLTMKEPSNPNHPKNKNAPTRVGAQFSMAKVYYNSSKLSRKIRTRKIESP
jgi:hypothetical protein